MDEDEDNIGEEDEEIYNGLGIISDSINLDVDHFGSTDILEDDRLFLDCNQ